MIANAEQAVEHLRHRGTGAHQRTKNIARNTKLVYVHDDLVGLKFHETIIAMYTRDGVVINTRDRWDDATDAGWFTQTTFARINEFTVARTFTSNGLRFLDDKGGDGAVLYAHGTKLDSNGTITERPMASWEQDYIVGIVSNLPTRIGRHCEKVLERWASFAQTPQCCREAYSEDSFWRHYLHHIDANEYEVLPFLDSYVNDERDVQTWGERLRSALLKKLRAELRAALVPIAVKRIAPGFPYPQTPRRRTI